MRRVRFADCTHSLELRWWITVVLQERARSSSTAGPHHAVRPKVAAGYAAGGYTGHSGRPRKESAIFALGTVRIRVLAERDRVYSRDKATRGRPRERPGGKSSGRCQHVQRGCSLHQTQRGITMLVSTSHWLNTVFDCRFNSLGLPLTCAREGPAGRQIYWCYCAYQPSV